MLEQTIELIDADVRRFDVTLLTAFPADCASSCIDAQQMKQVFLNVLNNARQAFPLPFGSARRARMHLRGG
ncbi:MAG: hypothetical protein ABIQ12_06325 [Opitutaceae bacterium]